MKRPRKMTEADLDFIADMWPEEAPELTGDLRAAHDALFAAVRRDECVICPCCNKPAQRQHESIGWLAAVALVCLVSKYRVTNFPMNVNFFSAGRTGVATMRHLGLLLPGPNNRPGEEDSGEWSPTDDGIQFAYNNRSVPRGVIKYNNRVLEFEDDLVRIRDLIKGDNIYEAAVACMEGRADLYEWIAELKRVVRPKFVFPAKMPHEEP